MKMDEIVRESVVVEFKTEFDLKFWLGTVVL